MQPRTHPDLAFMLPKLSRWLALGFGSGLVRWAPGTFGTVFGWLSWLAMAHWLAPEQILWLCVPAFLVGVWACERTGHALGVHDHSAIVWDEVVAFWILLSLTPATWPMQVAAFLLFRVFDIVKPTPIRQLDARIANGWGVMLDDLVAAGYAALILTAWRALA
ncbi:MAG: phosphatidylglycerophosphatase A [Quisquiliibacterium sp.]